MVSLNESDISTDSFSHLGPYTLSEETRYVRWLLAAAGSGNTQLNNIVITKRQEQEDDPEDDDVGIEEPSVPDSPNPYPNPTTAFFRWNLCEEGISVSLFDITGQLIRQWENVPDGELLDITGVAPGHYIIKAVTSVGNVTKKLIIK